MENQRTFMKPDKHGNVLIAVFKLYEDNPKKVRAITVRIRVRGEQRERTIGVYDSQEHIFHVRRDSEKHFHRLSRSYGFNWDILNDSIFKDMRCVRMLIDGKFTFDIPLRVIKEHGRPLMFKQQGFELQLFVPYEIIKQYSVITKN